MWLAQSVLSEVEVVAVIRYVGRDEALMWNSHRRNGELRLFCGWMWTAKRGGSYRQGLKTRSACYRDAWYALVAQTAVPAVHRPRIVSRKAA